MVRREELNLNSPGRELDEDLLTLHGVGATLHALAKPNDPFLKESRDNAGSLIETISVIDTTRSGQIRNIRLSDGLAQEAGLGRRVHADVVGDISAGIAVILKSARPFSSRRYGFSLVHPVTPEDLLLMQGPRDFIVKHGEVSEPAPNTVNPANLLGGRACQELFDGNELTPCTPDMAADLLLAFRERLNRYEDQ